MPLGSSLRRRGRGVSQGTAGVAKPTDYLFLNNEADEPVADGFLEDPAGLYGCQAGIKKRLDASRATTLICNPSCWSTERTCEPFK